MNNQPQSDSTVPEMSGTCLDFTLLISHGDSPIKEVNLTREMREQLESADDAGNALLWKWFNELPDVADARS